MELDWSSQEYGIAAALSQDPRMMEAYRSGDPYIHLAKLAKAVPEHANSDSHPKERGVFKSPTTVRDRGVMGIKG
jgi:DNA polymerase-1